MSEAFGNGIIYLRPTSYIMSTTTIKSIVVGFVVFLCLLRSVEAVSCNNERRRKQATFAVINNSFGNSFGGGFGGAKDMLTAEPVADSEE